MKFPLFRSLRSHRLAFGLALTALLAQLLLVTLSAAHQVQMRGAGAWEVCTARGVEPAAEGTPSGDTRRIGTSECAVCIAAAASLLVGGCSAMPPQVAWSAPQVSHVARVPHYRTERLRPPVRAPPAAT